MIDDSLVRGTTAGPLVKLLRDAGATEVHVRITCPPITHACHFGVDMGHDGDLMAARLTVEEIREHIGADSLAFLSLDGMMRAITVDPGDDGQRRCRGLLQRLLHRPLSDGGRRGPSQAGVRGRAGVRVLVIGSGGRESAIAWACRRHGHEVTIAADSRHRDAARRPGDRRPRDGAGRRRRRRVPAPAGSRASAQPPTSPARIVEGLCPRAGDRARACRRRVICATSSADEAIAWWRAARRADRREAGRAGGRQGRHRAGHRRRDHSTQSSRSSALGPIVVEERLTGPECSLMALCDGTVALPAADRPGPQADRRGRHRAEHRRDGRLRPGADRLRRRRR